MRRPRTLLVLLALGGACHGAVGADFADSLKPGWEIRLARPGEAGQPAVVEGRVRRADGAPAAGTMLYVRQADHRGVYPAGQDPREIHRPRPLSGWLRTDPAGRYRIVTVRPGIPAGTGGPARIHLALFQGEGTAPRPLPDFVLVDDPRGAHRPGSADDGLVHGRRDTNGVWRGTRTIVLPR